MPDSRNWFAPVPASRQRRFAASARQGVEVRLQDRALINFASNDYLGLSFHADVRQAAIAAIEHSGLGSGASRLVSGDDPALHALEARLAAWKGYEACLIVGSGMLANIGLLQALADRYTEIFADRLNHASLVDGARLSGARLNRFHHLDLKQLAAQLEKSPTERRLIVSDGVFSMDGDCADVAALLDLAEQHDGLLLIDDAHGIGTVGPHGLGLSGEPDCRGSAPAGHARMIEVGTFGKAFGGYGAFILGTAELIEGLRQRQRTMIYSTALPLAMIASADAALTLIEAGDLLRQLHGNIAYFRQQTSDLPIKPSSTAIQPLIIGSDAEALRAANHLRQGGCFVPAIRPPTVPEGSARLRITLTAAHSHEQIDTLVSALEHL